jgi:hypothetical protein
MPSPAKAELRSVWSERLRRWKSSGLSIVEFCRQERISQPSFFHWRKRLKQEASTAVGKPQFVELLPPAWTEPVDVKISLPGGAVVHVPQNSSVEVITAVVRAAMAAAQEERPC